MAVQCAGARSIEAAPDSTLKGESVVSIAFWVRVNEGSGAVDGDALLLGRSDGLPFRVELMQGTAARLRIAWTSAKGAKSTFDVELTPGVATHVATVYTPGLQQYFIDGKLASTTHCPDGPAVPVETSAFRIGSGGGDAVAIWTGHALSADEIHRLREGEVQPHELAAESLARGLTLEGHAGANAAVGGPGLVDPASGHHDDVAISSQPLTCARPGARRCVPAELRPKLSPPGSPPLYWIGGSGTTLVISFGADYGSPTVKSAPGPAPTCSINNGAPITAGLALWCNPAEDLSSSPNVVYLLPTTVKSTDTVTVSLAAGAIVTTAGPCAALTNVPCVNYAGERSPLPSLPPSGRTMRLGTMPASPSSYFTPINFYANWIASGNFDWYGPDFMPWGLTCGGFGPDGMMVSPNSVDEYSKVTLGSASDVCTTKGYPLAPTGPYTLLWDGFAASVYEDWNAPIRGVSDDPAQRITGQTVNNRRVYPSVPVNGTTNSPSCTTRCTFDRGRATNLRLYDKYITNPANAPRFHPLFLSKLAGSACYRWKDLFGIDGGCPVANLSDHVPYSTQSVSDQPTSGRIGITRLDPYSNGPYVRGSEQGIKVTCASPHGLQPGQFVALYFPQTVVSANDVFFYTITYSDNSTERVFWNNVMALPVSATEFVVPRQGQTLAIQPAVLPSGCQLWRKWAGAPVKDAVDLTNAISGCDGWASIPHAATDQYVTDLVTYVAQNLLVGRHFWIEYTNEHWNTAGSYPQSQFVQLMAREFALQRAALGDTSWNDAGYNAMHWWYVMRTAQIRALARAAWQAAGRSLSDISVMLGSQWSNGGLSSLYATLLTQFDAQGRRPVDSGYAGPLVFDALAVAPYLITCPIDTSNTTTAQFDALTVPQVMDLNDSWLLYIRATTYGTFAKQHVAAAASMGPGVKTITYEGGPYMLGLGTFGDNKTRRTAAASLHPRVRNQALAFWAMFDECGFSLFTKCCQAGPFGSEFGNCMGTYIGLEQQDGLGDGSDGLTDNRPLIMDPTTQLAIPMDLSTVVSPIGSAVHAWQQLPALCSSPPRPAVGDAMRGRGAKSHFHPRNRRA